MKIFVSRAREDGIGSHSENARGIIERPQEHFLKFLESFRHGQA